VLHGLLVFQGCVPCDSWRLGIEISLLPANCTVLTATVCHHEATCGRQACTLLSRRDCRHPLCNTTLLLAQARLLAACCAGATLGNMVCIANILGAKAVMNLTHIGECNGCK
jgi:hypothetical protein